MKSFEFDHIQKYLRVAEHNKPVVHVCGWSEELVSKHGRSRFIVLFCEMSCHIDMVYAVNDVEVCAWE
jgi:hypothetical protein